MLASVIVNVDKVWVEIEHKKLMRACPEIPSLYTYACTHAHTHALTHPPTHPPVHSCTYPPRDKIGLLAGSVNHIECIAVPIPFIP